MQLLKGTFECMGCGESFQATYVDEKPGTCPHCRSGNINLVNEKSAEDSTVSKGGCGGCGCGTH